MFHIADIIRDIFDNDLFKYGILTVIVAAVIGAGFITMNLNSEGSICAGAGYGEYDDFKGICKVNGEHADYMIIVAGNTANSPVPKIQENTSTYNYFKNTIASGANVKIVSAASDLSTQSIKLDIPESNDAKSFIDSIDSTIAKVNEKLESAPTANGATYLEAIQQAGRDAASWISNNDNKTATVLVIGSGLSDGGILNFAKNNLLSKETEDIMDALQEAGALSRSLTDVDIIWSGIGQVRGPQEMLHEKAETILQEIYRKVLKEKGAKKVTFDETILETKTIEDNQYTVIPTQVGAIVIGDFGDETLPFKGGTAEFKDDKNAAKVLEGAVKKAKDNPRQPITITGYMAPDSCNGNSDTSLAEARANRVKEYLESRVKNDIEVINGGVYQPDISVCDANGNRIPEREQEKRRVVIKLEWR